MTAYQMLLYERYYRKLVNSIINSEYRQLSLISNIELQWIKEWLKALINELHKLMVNGEITADELEDILDKAYNLDLYNISYIVNTEDLIDVILANTDILNELSIINQSCSIGKYFRNIGITKPDEMTVSEYLRLLIFLIKLIENIYKAYGRHDLASYTRLELEKLRVIIKSEDWEDWEEIFEAFVTKSGSYILEEIITILGIEQILKLLDNVDFSHNTFDFCRRVLYKNCCKYTIPENKYKKLALISGKLDNTTICIHLLSMYLDFGNTGEQKTIQ